GDELPYLTKYLQRVTQSRTRRRFPEAASALHNEDFINLAKLYQLRVRQLDSTKPFMTDKMPWNFQLVGLIYKAMPWAKVIHIYRNPVDCGFSNFRSPLSKDIQYSCSFEGFAYYRRIYQDFMNLWHATLPGFFLDLCYEELVEHPEREIRRVLDFCGLPWEDKLMAFHSTKREIRTISRNQVSKPLNRESIGYEKKYGKLLDPLKEALRGYGLIDAEGRPRVSGSARP
ncbi:MAG TPA: sulfotransferase, partial [Sphingomonadales bacterium]|nr:sulfotransferase [Sphingomonadales bacterium]